MCGERSYSTVCTSAVNVLLNTNAESFQFEESISSRAYMKAVDTVNNTCTMCLRCRSSVRLFSKKAAAAESAKRTAEVAAYLDDQCIVGDDTDEDEQSNTEYEVKCKPCIPRFCTANWLDTREEIPDIFNQLDLFEQSLISLATPIVSVNVLPGGQLGTRGKCYIFTSDLALDYSLPAKLPRTTASCGVVIVYADTGKTSKRFKVNVQLVLRCLAWLKVKNPLYYNVTIDAADLIAEQKAIDDTYAVLQGQKFDTVLVADVDPVADKPIHHGSKSSSVSTVDLLRTKGQLLNTRSTPFLFSKLFPSLFQDAKGDYFGIYDEQGAPCPAADCKIERPVKLSLSQYAQHLMYLDDDRFATHPKFIFILQIMLAQRQAYSEISLTARRQDNVKRDQLLKALEVNGQHVLPNDLMEYINKNTSLTRSMPGYPGFWRMWRIRLLTMMNEIGAPEVFFTGSGADNQWPDGFKYIDDSVAFKGCMYLEL